jgi:hypothetical protein
LTDDALAEIGVFPLQTAEPVFDHITQGVRDVGVIEDGDYKISWEVLPSGVADQAKWAADLTLLAEQFAALPPVWRYDAVSLRHEQVNPDYEHLWFHFDNAAFGARRWPSFEFRLSAANVRKGKCAGKEALKEDRISECPLKRCLVSGE